MPEQNTKLNTSLDLRELAFEYFMAQISYFHINQAVTLNWPTPNTSLAATSVATDPVDIRGRYHHYIQVTGINNTSGDTVAIQVSIDGTNYVTAPMTPLAGGAAVTSITSNGIYFVNGNFWYIDAVVTAGSNTGLTAVTLMSRPD